MIEQIINFFMQVLVTILVCKLYCDFRMKKAKSAEKPKMDWKDATPHIENLEARIARLTERDASSRETIWNLEDQIRTLKLHYADARRQMKKPISETPTED